MVKLVYWRRLNPRESLEQRMRWSEADARWRQPPLYDGPPSIEPDPVAGQLTAGATLGGVETTAAATKVI